MFLLFNDHQYSCLHIPTSLQSLPAHPFQFLRVAVGEKKKSTSHLSMLLHWFCCSRERENFTLPSMIIRIFTWCGETACGSFSVRVPKPLLASWKSLREGGSSKTVCLLYTSARKRDGETVYIIYFVPSPLQWVFFQFQVLKYEVKLILVNLVMFWKFKRMIL